MKIKMIIPAIKDQMPIKRLLKNIFNGNIIGIFHKRSHFTKNGKEKVSYNTKDTALKACEKMYIKTGNIFKSYKCLHCSGYHIGKNNF